MNYYRSFWDSIKLVRIIKGGDWVKTMDHGWIRSDLYYYYKSLGYDPGLIKYELKETK